jgi:glycosyltransferase involved in cell wall biosynthesis
MASAPKVVASVVTFNRVDGLLKCLAALAAQTTKPAEVLVVDNGSTDGTERAVAESGIAQQLPLVYVRLARNAGAAGGYHVAFREALKRSPDWIWVMPDDAVAEPDALEQMLSSEPTQSDRTAALCPAVRGPNGHLQPEYTGGTYRFGQRVPVSPGEHDANAVRIEHSSFMGMLVRASAVADVGAPRAEFFLSGDDLEWFLRLRDRWAVWLVPPAEIVHQDPIPPSGTGALGALRRALRPIPDSEVWKHAYSFRNMSWIRSCYDGEGGVRFALNVMKEWIRILHVNHPIRRMRVMLDYGLAGRRGDFRNCPPELWAEYVRRRGGRRRLAEALAPVRDRDLRLAGPPERL